MRKCSVTSQTRDLTGITPTHGTFGSRCTWKLEGLTLAAPNTWSQAAYQHTQSACINGADVALSCASILNQQHQ